VGTNRVHMKYLVSFLIFGGMIYCASCAKDDSIVVKNNAPLLTGVKWEVISIISVDSLNKETDLYSTLPAFMKDDYFLFNADSTYELNDNVVLRADSASAIIDAGNWELTHNGDSLELHSNFFSTTYYPAFIKELTQTSLSLERYYPGDKAVVRTKYKAIQ
jgi:hypothetical protein